MRNSPCPKSRSRPYVIDTDRRYGYNSHMKIAKISELRDKLSRFLDHVKAGGRVIILDRDKPVAEIVPIGATGDPDDDTDVRQLEALERDGIVRRGQGDFPEELFRGPIPGKGSGVLKALLEERERSR